MHRSGTHQVRRPLVFAVILTVAAAFATFALTSRKARNGPTVAKPPAAIAAFYQSMAEALAVRDPRRIIDVEPHIRSLKWPDDFEPVPPAVLEASGFYWLNRQESDNGNVYLFRADANGTPTYGVLGTSDGSDRWLEVYGLDGTLLGAARLDSGVILWRDREAVRRKVWEGTLEPELSQARERQIRDRTSEGKRR